MEENKKEFEFEKNSLEGMVYLNDVLKRGCVKTGYMVGYDIYESAYEKYVLSKMGDSKCFIVTSYKLKGGKYV